MKFSLSPDDGHPNRVLTIGRTFRYRLGFQVVSLPFIRLSGKWLERAGFQVGHTIDVTVRPGTIVLKVRARAKSGQ